MNHEELYKVIGQHIRKARKARSLKQDDLAAAVSLTRASIANIELGRQKLLLHTLYEIAIVLDVEPSSLLPEIGRVETRLEVTSEQQKDLSPEELEMLRSAITISKKRR